MNNGGCNSDERLITTIQSPSDVSFFDLKVGKGCINLWGQRDRTTLGVDWKLYSFPALFPGIASHSSTYPKNSCLKYLLIFYSQRRYSLYPKRFLWVWLNAVPLWLIASFFLWLQCNTLSSNKRGTILLHLDDKSFIVRGVKVAYLHDSCGWSNVNWVKRKAKCIPQTRFTLWGRCRQEYKAEVWAAVELCHWSD